MRLFFYLYGIMKNVIIYSILIFLGLIACETNTNEPSAESIITQQMKEQEDCWNNGDLDCFMQHYWQDDSLEFVGKSGLTRGWKQTLDNYKKSYPTPEKMGKLSFDIIKNKQIDFTTLHTIGKWQLIRKEIGDTLAGHFSLIWQKRQQKWVIISDHSS